MAFKSFTLNGVYRYGFNRKENDNEVKLDFDGNNINGAQQDYGMRIYDPRLGRFLSVDPIGKSYPWYTPYSFAGNSPIEHVDLDGEEEYHYTLLMRNDGSGYLKTTAPTVYYHEHSWFGGLVQWKDRIYSQKYSVQIGANTYYIGYASDAGRSNLFKAPIFKQFLKHPDNVDVTAFLKAFDNPSKSRMKAFTQDMQLSVASSLIAHQAILEGQQHAVSSEVSNLREENSPELKPYGGKGGGHHVVAKKAFEGESNYNENTALAIPNSELARLNVRHTLITGAQMKLYKAFAATGNPLTWDAISVIETKVLVSQGITKEAAQQAVIEAINNLKQAGVSQPTKIPWGGKN